MSLYPGHPVLIKYLDQIYSTDGENALSVMSKRLKRPATDATEKNAPEIALEFYNKHVVPDPDLQRALDVFATEEVEREAEAELEKELAQLVLEEEPKKKQKPEEGSGLFERSVIPDVPKKERRIIVKAMDRRVPVQRDPSEQSRMQQRYDEKAHLAIDDVLYTLQQAEKELRALHPRGDAVNHRPKELQRIRIAEQTLGIDE
jgi:hypothetical protein